MPFGGAIVLPTGAGNATAFPTLAELYVDLAKNLGTYLSYGVSTTATAGEPGRWVLLDETADDEDIRGSYGGAWAYVKTGPQTGAQRRIRTEGFEGPYGALALARVLPANLAANTLVEVTDPLPVRTSGRVRGLIDFCNEGLNRIWTEVYLPFTGDGTRSHPLNGYPWITNETIVNGLWDWRGSADQTAPASPAWMVPTIRVNGATITLETPTAYSTGVPFQLRVYVRADRLTYDGSAWGYAQNGLVNGSDQAAIALETVRPVAALKALQYLTRYVAELRRRGQINLQDSQVWITELLDQRKMWAQAAAAVVERSLPRPSLAPSPALTRVTLTTDVPDVVGTTPWP
jgi:hypothetical protein